MDILELLKDFKRTYSCNNDIEIINENIAELATTLNIGKHHYTLSFKTNQKDPRIMLNFYPEVKVQSGKIIDAIMLCNYLNCQYYYNGGVVLLADIEACFCYKVLLDINNIEKPTVSLLLRLLADATHFFQRFNGIICDIAYTPKTFEAIQRDIENKKN